MVHTWKSSTFKKTTMNIKFLMREKTLQPFLKSLKSNYYYTHNKKMHLIFVWISLLSASTQFFCSSTTKSIWPSSICPHPGNGKQWPVLLSGVQWDQIFSNEPDRPWRPPHVLPLLFLDLCLHVRHILKHIWFVCTQLNHWSSYDHKCSLSSSPPVISHGSSFPSITCSVKTQLMDNDVYLCLWINPQHYRKKIWCCFGRWEPRK